MDSLQAIILGIVQGLTEFLPISSSAHLVLVPWLLGWPPHSLAFDAALHLGTLLALLLYFWRQWLGIGRALLAGLGSADARQDPNYILGWLLILGSLPAAVTGLVAEKAIESALRQPQPIAMLLIVFGLLLLAAERLGPRQRSISDMTLADALLIGLAQALALAPGVSRSGVTMTAGLLLGLDRTAAARFSFLMSMPLVLAAGASQLAELLQGGDNAAELGALGAGLVAAALTSIGAIWFLLHFLQRN